MILTKVDDFFNWLFRDINNKFNWQALVVLLIGILLGIIISASTYGIILLISLKKQEKRHPSFVQDIDDEEVKIEFNGGQGPCIMVPTSGDGFVYLILPIRR